MAIINLTPDSFYAPSRVASSDVGAFLARVQSFAAAGASIIDLGAVSTRPGAVLPSLEEEWERLAAVTPEERERALKQLRRWVTWQIIYRGFSMDYGPFSPAAIGGNADDVITEECEEALFCGEWHWKSTCKLSTALIDIAKSKMSHIIENYYNRGRTAGIQAHQ